LIKTDLFNVLLLVAISLIFARVFGHLFNKLKQPAVIGEIVSGIFLGGLVVFFFSGQNFTIFNYVISPPTFDFDSNEFVLLAEIGILFLLFISGLETSISKLKKTGKVSTFVAIGGVIAPFFLGILSGILLSFSIQESIVIGLILTATSVGVTARTLMDLHVLDTDVGTTILGAAVIDDIIGILLLVSVMSIQSTIMDTVWIGVKILIFFAVFLYIGLMVIDKILDLGEKIYLPKAFLSLSISIFLLYSFFADEAGISGIIGAFVAGLIIGQNVRSIKISEDIKTIGYGLFIPIFFVWIGSRFWEESSTDLSLYAMIGLFAIVIIIVSIVGKIVGCGIGAKLGGMSNMESLQVGIGMIPRMEVALIIIATAISRGIITDTIIAHQLLIITILLSIFTTLVTPFLIKATFKNG